MLPPKNPLVAEHTYSYINTHLRHGDWHILQKQLKTASTGPIITSVCNNAALTEHLVWLRVIWAPWWAAECLSEWVEARNVINLYCQSRYFYLINKNNNLHFNYVCMYVNIIFIASEFFFTTNYYIHLVSRGNSKNKTKHWQGVVVL